MRDASSETLPKLDELASTIRTLGRDFNRKLAKLKDMIESPSRDAQIRSIQSLQSCLRTSADVVSSASTTLGASDTGSVLSPSDYRGVLPARGQTVMLRWLAESGNTARYTSQPQTFASVYGEVDIIEDSDSEAELEVEMLQLQLAKGKELLQTGNPTSAGKLLAAGISRLKHHRSRYLDAEKKLVMLDDLLKPLEEQENWDEAKKVRLEKMSVLSAELPTQSERYLEETLKLVELLLSTRHLEEGRIYARKCIKAYRKLGNDGHWGLKCAFALMISACQLDGDEPEEEAYKAMLAQLDVTTSDQTTADVVTENMIQPEAVASAGSKPLHSTGDDIIINANPSGPEPPHLFIRRPTEELQSGSPLAELNSQLQKIYLGERNESGEIIMPLFQDEPQEGDPDESFSESTSTRQSLMTHGNSTAATSITSPTTYGSETPTDLPRDSSSEETNSWMNPLLDPYSGLEVVVGLSSSRDTDDTTPTTRLRRAFSWEDDNVMGTNTHFDPGVEMGTSGVCGSSNLITSINTGAHAELPIPISTTVTSTDHVDNNGSGLSMAQSSPSPREVSTSPIMSSQFLDTGTNYDWEASSRSNSTPAIRHSSPALTIGSDPLEDSTNDATEPRPRVTTVIVGPSCSGKSSLIQ